jgi:hypothetical protein
VSWIKNILKIKKDVQPTKVLFKEGKKQCRMMKTKTKKKIKNSMSTRVNPLNVFPKSFDKKKNLEV